MNINSGSIKPIKNMYITCNIAFICYIFSCSFLIFPSLTKNFHRVEDITADEEKAGDVG